MPRLRLYITGETPTSQALITRLEHALSEEYPEGYELEVRNIFDDPEAAIDDEVIVTPTLLRLLPEPVRRLIGDLSDEERVLAGLKVEEN